jgi:hypothetical protein
VPPDTSQEEKQKKLKNRARSKFITNAVAAPLSTLRSPLEKAYKLSTRCAGELTETPGKLTGLYCGCRWCVVCSRIRTARFFQGYMPAIEKMEEKWFLTLSRPNVVAAALEDEVKYYLREASLIQRHLREKRELQYSSLRKIECTYNAEADTYHPHFHFIFDNFLAADLFLQEWLSRNPTARLDKGNQLKKADNGSVRELFKYFTKVVSKSKSKTPGGVDTYGIHLAALDTMFLALRAVRTFQPCGVIKAVSEEVEPTQALDSGRDETHFWKWLKNDWVNVETEQLLTGYKPEYKVQQIEKCLVYPAGVPVEAPADFVPYYVDKETGEVVQHEKAHLARNEWGYAKIYPHAPGSGSTRREPCCLVAVPWEDVQAQQLPEPAAPVPAAAVPAVQLGLFSQLTPASAARVVQPNVLAPVRPLVATDAQPLAAGPSGRLPAGVGSATLPFMAAAPAHPSGAAACPGRSLGQASKAVRRPGLSTAEPLDYYQALTSDSMLFH